MRHKIRSIEVRVAAPYEHASRVNAVLVSIGAITRRWDTQDEAGIVFFLKEKHNRQEEVRPFTTRLEARLRELSPTLRITLGFSTDDPQDASAADMARLISYIGPMERLPEPPKPQPKPKNSQVEFLDGLGIFA